MSPVMPSDFDPENAEPEGFVSPGLPVDKASTSGRLPIGDPEQIPDPAEVDIPDDLRDQIQAIVDKYPDRDHKGSPKSASIPVLWIIQRRYGWCTPEGIVQAAAVMQVTPAYLESVASFYDLLRTSPQGEHQVLVCTNIACWMRGGDELLDSFCAKTGADLEAAGHGGALSEDGRILVSGFECLGACDLAPMASVDERYFGPLENADASTIVDQLESGAEVLPEKALDRRGLAGGVADSSDPRVVDGKGPNQ
ncbi:MAG: NAD(P)H-dependent oxidoreductase subunit E [Solirubrobacterales bacterium]|nr:NAD(P)H-dependent oxidoreductase subunit E [Solirubrobacterales bacterium]HMT05720.1 NAD(P)H-dependent oxidoreductase subunit E [Solirubrobacterales bacterium]